MTGHWHSLFGTHLDEAEVHFQMSEPVSEAREARDTILDLLRDVASSRSDGVLAPVIIQAEAMPAETCRLMLGNTAFAVFECAGDDPDECIKAGDREGADMTYAHQQKMLTSALLAHLGRDELLDLVAKIATAEEGPPAQTGMYL